MKCLRSTSLAVGAVGASLLSGCAMIEKSAPEADDLQAELVEEQNDELVYEYGSAESPEAARNKAMQALAERVSTVVRGEQREVFRYTDEQARHEVDSQQRIESTYNTLAHVELQGLSFSEPMATEEGYLVEARIEQEDLEQARSRARLQAPALARFATIESLSDKELLQRLRLAFEGLEVAEQRRVLDDRVFSEEYGEQTFESYFKQIRRETINKLKVIPLLENDGEELRIGVVSAEHYAPQAQVELELAGERLETDDDGVTSTIERESLDSRETVTLHIDDHQFEVTTWRPSEWSEVVETQVLFHAQPDGQPVTVDDSQLSTPGRIVLPAGESYEYTLHGGQSFRDIEERFEIPEDAPYYYIHHQLEERDYGHLDLSVEDPGRLRLTGPEDLEGEEIEGEVEVGAYKLRVDPPEGKEQDEYETLLDEIVVSGGEDVQRVYDSPRNREQFYEGSLLRFDFLGVHSAGDSHKTEILADGDVSIGEFPETKVGRDLGVEEIEYGSGHYSLSFGYQRFREYWGGVPLYLGLYGGWRSEKVEVTDTQGNEHETTLSVLHASPTVGFWKPLGEQSVIYAGAGYSADYRILGDAETDSYDNEDMISDMFESRGLDTDPVASLGIYGDGVGLTFRYIGGNQDIGIFNLSIGKNTVHSDYRHPDSRRAREGEDYRVLRN